MKPKKEVWKKRIKINLASTCNMTQSPVVYLVVILLRNTLLTNVLLISMILLYRQLSYFTPYLLVFATFPSNYFCRYHLPCQHIGLSIIHEKLIWKYVWLPFIPVMFYHYLHIDFTCILSLFYYSFLSCPTNPIILLVWNNALKPMKIMASL